jgi:GNAT superfamily N-acetyltransferase
VERLWNVCSAHSDDLPALLDLYPGYRDNAFQPDQLAGGVFYGVRDGGCLVAAAGTQVTSARYGIAAVGSIFTRPEARRRGFGAAVTSAVVAELLAGFCRDAILNVAAANEPAHPRLQPAGLSDALPPLRGVGHPACVTRDGSEPCMSPRGERARPPSRSYRGWPAHRIAQAPLSRSDRPLSA